MWIVVIKYNPFEFALGNCLNVGVALIQSDQPAIAKLSDHKEFDPRVKMGTRACVNRMIHDCVHSAEEIIKFASKEANSIRVSAPIEIYGDAQSVLDDQFQKFVGGPSYPFPDPNRVESKPVSLSEELIEIERKRITHALTLSAGNQSKAARMLGISRYIIMDRMDSLGIPRPRKGRN